MSLFDYQAGQRLAAADEPFYGLIQAAMRRADGTNIVRLRLAWPEVWDELQQRYESPGGLLPDETFTEPEPEDTERDDALRDNARIYEPDDRD